MTDEDCIAFLQWALPRLERSWAGYRKVRGLVCKRLGRRLRVLGLADVAAYRSRLEAEPGEWKELDSILGIPVSRFYRDRGVFASLESAVLPALARAAPRAARTTIDCWSAGCASGEEPYTLSVVWHLRLQPAFPQLTMRVVATDMDATLLTRAERGCYLASSLKELAPDLVSRAFETRDGELCLKPQFRDVTLMRQDLRTGMPDGPFDLVLCRNVVLTYYAAPVQLEFMRRIADRLRPGGALVVGMHESLPPEISYFKPWPGARGVYVRTAKATGD
jgi:chemotaxis protein methyltransferase CheR